MMNSAFSSPSLMKMDMDEEKPNISLISPVSFIVNDSGEKCSLNFHSDGFL